MENNSDKSRTVELTPELEAKLKEIELKEKNKPAPKGKKGLLIAVIALLLVVAAACVAVSLNKRGDRNADSVSTSESTEVTTSEKTKLIENLAILNFVSGDREENKNMLTTGEIESGYMLTETPTFYQKTGYTKKQKLYAILWDARYNKSAFKPLDDTDYKFSDFSHVLKGTLFENADWDEFKENVKYITVEETEKKFSELYGEDIEHMSVNDVCGGFIYDEKNGFYLAGLLDACGGMDFRSVIVRVFDFKKTADEFTVDVNAVSAWTEPDSTPDKNDEPEDICNIYDDVYALEDVSAGKVYKKCELDTEGRANFKLSDSDRDAVAKYRYTFDKDFHFKSIKKL